MFDFSTLFKCIFTIILLLYYEYNIIYNYFIYIFIYNNLDLFFIH